MFNPVKTAIVGCGVISDAYLSAMRRKFRMHGLLLTQVVRLRAGTPNPDLRRLKAVPGVAFCRIAPGLSAHALQRGLHSVRRMDALLVSQRDVRRLRLLGHSEVLPGESFFHSLPTCSSLVHRQSQRIDRMRTVLPSLESIADGSPSMPQLARPRAWVVSGRRQGSTEVMRL